METPPAVEHVIKKIKDSWWVVLIHAIWKAVTATIDFILLLLPPPALASLVGILVGIVTPLRELFFPMGKAPLTWLTASIETWGKAMVFTSSFVLGAVLSKGPGQGVKRVGVRTVASIVLIRLVLTPILGKAIVFMTYFLGWWKLPTVGGYTFFFILLLQQWYVNECVKILYVLSLLSITFLLMYCVLFNQTIAACQQRTTCRIFQACWSIMKRRWARFFFGSTSYH